MIHNDSKGLLFGVNATVRLEGLGESRAVLIVLIVERSLADRHNGIGVVKDAVANGVGSVIADHCPLAKFCNSLRPITSPPVLASAATILAR